MAYTLKYSQLLTGLIFRFYLKLIFPSTFKFKSLFNQKKDFEIVSDENYDFKSNPSSQ
jgi:hypothetical protein